MRRICIAYAFFAAAAAGCAAQAADPRALWDRAVEAKGGHEALQAVHSLAIYMKPAEVMLAGSLTNWLCVFPDRYFEFHLGSAVRGDDPRRVIVLDAASGRVAMDVQGRPRAAARTIGPDQHDQLVLNQLLFLLDTPWLQPRLIDSRHDRLTVEAGGRRFEISFDHDGRPSRVVSLSRPHEPAHLYDYRLQRYRAFEGVWLPARVANVFGVREWTWDVDYEINARYNPSLFTRNPDLADGPEPWRRK